MAVGSVQNAWDEVVPAGALTTTPIGHPLTTGAVTSVGSLPTLGEKYYNMVLKCHSTSFACLKIGLKLGSICLFSSAFINNTIVFYHDRYFF